MSVSTVCLQTGRLCGDRRPEPVARAVRDMTAIMPNLSFASGVLARDGCAVQKSKDVASLLARGPAGPGQDERGASFLSVLEFRTYNHTRMIENIY